MNIGNNIKELRLKKKWTQEQLAKAAGVSRISIGNYERNSRTPDAITLDKIAKALNVTIEVLIIDKTFSQYILSCMLDIFKDTSNPIEVIANTIKVSSEELSAFVKNNEKNLPLEIQKKLLAYISRIDERSVKQIYNDVIFFSHFAVHDEIKEFLKENFYKDHLKDVVSFQHMKKIVYSRSPHLDALKELLTNSNVEMFFGYSYSKLAKQGYDKLLISTIENAIKDTLTEIKEKEKEDSIYVQSWGRWISKDDERYESIKKVYESQKSNDLNSNS